MAENATNAPVASRFVFIYEVPTLAPTAKVRLVGWYALHIYLTSALVC